MIDNKTSKINIGDYIQMGKYYDEPILWRCVDIDENGPLMLSDKILCLKPFDAAGNHKYLDGTDQADTESQWPKIQFGSTLWETSNMRCWLNSTEGAGNVTWLDGCPPTANMVRSGFNAYASEKGFLEENNFTANERNAIKSVTQRSLLNGVDVKKMCKGGNDIHTFYPSLYHETLEQNYNTAFYHNVKDKMFLLDIKQLVNMYQNSEIIGYYYYMCEPTKKAVANSEYKNSELSATERWNYWLRSPSTNYYLPTLVRDVTFDGYVLNDSANSGSLGVRPAFYINLSSAIFTDGNGTEKKIIRATVQ